MDEKRDRDKLVDLDKLGIGGKMMKGIRINPRRGLLNQVIVALDRFELPLLNETPFFDFEEGDDPLAAEQLGFDIEMLEDLLRVERFRRAFAEQCRAERIEQRDKLLGITRGATMEMYLGLTGPEMMMMKPVNLDSYNYTLPQMEIDEVNTAIGNGNPKRPLYSFLNVNSLHPQVKDWARFITDDITAIQGFITVKDIKLSFIRKVLDFCLMQKR